MWLSVRSNIVNFNRNFKSNLRTAIRFQINCSTQPNKAKQSDNRAASKVALHVIGCGAPGEPASVCLSTPGQNYLFNCGEGCHRLLDYYNQNVSLIKNIFVTQLKWNSIGGISSVTKTILNTTKRLPIFHGPENLYKCIKRVLCLSIMSELDFFPADCNQNLYFEDDTFRIDFIPLKSNICRTGVYAYLGKIKPRQGKFSIELCQSKNVPQQFYNKLQSDESVRVLLDNGTEIKAKDVRVGYQPEVNFLILDVPATEYLSNLEQHSQLSHRLDEIRCNEPKLDIVVHFSPKSVVDSASYRDFVARSNAKLHSYLNTSNESSRLTSVYELQGRLNQIDSKVHPNLSSTVDTSFRICYNDDQSNVSSGLFSIYYLRKPNEIQSEEVIDNRHHYENAKLSNANDNQTSFDFERFKRMPKIVFLGTGSAIATQRRNVSSILVHTTRNNCILLDCGEGTYGQIHRFYGKTAIHIIRKIKAVFISHLHIDHHSGLLELLEMRKQYLKSNRKPLIVMCPKGDLKSWLFFYDNLINAIHDDLYFIDNENLMTLGLSYAKCKELGIDMLRTCRVPHFNTSYAVTFAVGERNPFKITFSGDTPPCDQLVGLGKNSTLLIHEATFSDKMAEYANETHHSTVSQAIEQGKKMNAKYTILHHISRRCNGIPYFDSKLNPNVGVAFDNMEIIESDLPKLSDLYEKYQKLF